MQRLFGSVSLALSFWLAGCASGVPAAPVGEPVESHTAPPVKRIDALPAPQLIELANESIHPQGARTELRAPSVSEDPDAVPPFELVDMAGEAVRSDEMVGKQAFAVVFFATWCELCARKMPLIRRAFEKVHGVRLMLVAVDSSDTWSHIPGFLREQRMGEEQVVNGMEFPNFTQGYNPVSSIPLVAVVGRDGGLVDYQIGLHDGDGPRLEASLRAALLD